MYHTIMYSIFVFSSLILSVYSQCAAEDSPGPCIGACDAGFTCDTAADMCCPDATTAAAVTTAATVTGTGTTVAVTTVAGSATTTRSSTASCVDLLNPSTGISDCPARAALCNDALYYDVMTVQCPRTCGRCSSTSTGSSTSCVDLLNPSTGVSDCPNRRALCTNSQYLSLMRVQCPLTCGFCSSGSATTSSSSTNSTACVDLLNPATGVSDCPNRRALCTNAVYNTLMRQQCPLTCGFCSASGTTASSATTASGSTTAASTGSTSAGTCVDRLNPATGVSDCPNRASLCTNAIYAQLMRQQCPLTCGFC